MPLYMPNVCVYLESSRFANRHDVCVTNGAFDMLSLQ